MSEPRLLTAILAFAIAAVVYVSLLLLGQRLWRWARTPQPVPIPLTPAPRTRTGVLGRLLLEVLLFKTLLRASPVTWLGCVLMHYGLLLTVLLHLRFLWPQTPSWLIPLIPAGTVATVAFAAGLLLLLARRMVLRRIRYVSIPSDYGWLLLLLAIAGSGYLLKHSAPVDAYQVGRFLRAALGFNVSFLPDGAVLWIHLLLVLALVALFPIGKLLHGPGVVFAPTLNARAPARVSDRAP